MCFCFFQKIYCIDRSQPNLPKLNQKKIRIYQNNLKFSNSRKISFLPKYFEIFEEKHSRGIKNRTKKKNFFKNLFSVFLPFFYSFFILTKFIFLRKLSFPFYFVFFYENLHSLLISTILIYLLILNFFQKVLLSYLFEFTLVSTFFYCLITKIENLFFFNQRVTMSFLLALWGNLGIIFVFWNQNKLNWILKNSYSKKIIHFREIRWILTILSVVKIFIWSQFFFYELLQNFIKFPYFFVNFSIYIPLEKLIFFSKKSLLFKSGGDLLSIFSILTTLVYGGFFFILNKKRIVFYLGYFKVFKLLLGYSEKNFKEKQIKYESVFLKKDEKHLMFIDNLISQEFSDNNFSPKKNLNRWNIKKSGINVLFPISLRNNEFPFKKKDFKWQIKKK